MSTTSIYRTVAVLIVLFATGHTLGFHTVDPKWGVSAAINTLQITHFTAQGTPGRTYWGFYMGFGYFCSALMFLSAALAWQLSRLSRETLRQMRFLTWAFAVAFAVASAITWIYFFTAAMAFSTLIAIGLFVGAWRVQVGVK